MLVWHMPQVVWFGRELKIGGLKKCELRPNELRCRLVEESLLRDVSVLWPHGLFSIKKNLETCQFSMSALQAHTTTFPSISSPDHINEAMFHALSSRSQGSPCLDDRTHINRCKWEGINVSFRALNTAYFGVLSGTNYIPEVNHFCHVLLERIDIPFLKVSCKSDLLFIFRGPLMFQCLRTGNVKHELAKMCKFSINCASKCIFSYSNEPSTLQNI